MAAAARGLFRRPTSSGSPGGERGGLVHHPDRRREVDPGARGDRGDGKPAPVERISDEIVVSVLYTPRQEQPESVIAVLGKDGENVSGKGVNDTWGFVTYEARKALSFPVKK